MDYIQCSPSSQISLSAQCLSLSSHISPLPLVRSYSHSSLLMHKPGHNGWIAPIWWRSTENLSLCPKLKENFFCKSVVCFPVRKGRISTYLLFLTFYIKSKLHSKIWRINKLSMMLVVFIREKMDFFQHVYV